VQFQASDALINEAASFRTSGRHMVDGRDHLLMISEAEVTMSRMTRRKFSSSFSDGEFPTTHPDKSGENSPVQHAQDVPTQSCWVICNICSSLDLSKNGSLPWVGTLKCCRIRWGLLL